MSKSDQKYNTRIPKGGALLDDMRMLVRSWEEIEADALRGFLERFTRSPAPLLQLLPSWPETEKAWKELEEEKFAWSHQAMYLWPDRVREKCKTDRSFAIAHGLDQERPQHERN